MIVSGKALTKLFENFTSCERFKFKDVRFVKLNDFSLSNNKKSTIASISFEHCTGLNKKNSNISQILSEIGKNRSNFNSFNSLEVFNNKVNYEEDVQAVLAKYKINHIKVNHKDGSDLASSEDAGDDEENEDSSEEQQSSNEVSHTPDSEVNKSSESD